MNQCQTGQIASKTQTCQILNIMEKNSKKFKNSDWSGKNWSKAM